MTRTGTSRMQATRSTAQTVAIGNAKRGRDRVTCTKILPRELNLVLDVCAP